MGKIIPVGIFNELKTKIKKNHIVDSIQNTAEAFQIIRKRPPEEIREIIFREGNPLNTGNTDLVAKINKLMSKDLANKVYKNL